LNVSWGLGRVVQHPGLLGWVKTPPRFATKKTWGFKQ
jgi:hypothetical protein